MGFPEYMFQLESGVMCLDFNPAFPSLLAVGCYDGSVKIVDVRKGDNRPIFSSDVKTGRHSDPVWEVKWAPPAPEKGKEMSFYSISSDGKVASWVVTKAELKMEVVMTLKLTAPSSSSPSSGGAGAGAGLGTTSFGLTSGGAGATPADAMGSTAASAFAMGMGGAGAGGVGLGSTAGSSSSSSSAAGGGGEDGKLAGLAGGCCFAFSPFQENVFLVGTEEGKIHKCLLDYSGQYSATFEGHTMAVYAVRWNPFHPRVFLSCSADWTVKMWDESHPTAILSFDLDTSIGDIMWAPYSSTVFAAVTDEGKINVYDLHANKHEQLCEQKVVKKAKCTHVLFNSRAPIVLVSDTNGAVTSLKLSPNLRKITPLPAGGGGKKGAAASDDTPGREEVEIRKLDRILALSDAKISIVTPIPGLEKAKAKEGAAAAASGAAAGGDGEEAGAGGDGE